MAVPGSSTAGPNRASPGSGPRRSCWLRGQPGDGGRRRLPRPVRHPGPDPGGRQRGIGGPAPRWERHRVGSPWSLTTTEVAELIARWRRIVAAMRAVRSAHFDLASDAGFGLPSPAPYGAGLARLHLLLAEQAPSSPSRRCWRARGPRARGDDPGFVGQFDPGAAAKHVMAAVVWDSGMWGLSSGSCSRSLAELKQQRRAVTRAGPVRPRLTQMDHFGAPGIRGRRADGCGTHPT